MTANSKDTAESCNDSASIEEDGQTRREHLRMLGAGLGLAALPTAAETAEGHVHDSDIWLYDEPLTASPSLLVETRAVHLDATARDFEPSNLEVRGWGHENEVLIDVHGNFDHGTANTSLVLDPANACQLAKRLLETTQWLEEFQEAKDDV